MMSLHVWVEEQMSTFLLAIHTEMQHGASQFPSGRRIAMELRRAAEQDRLLEVLT